MNRAYSILEVKSLDDEKRIIRGVATTPAPDRVGDIVEPLGVKFTNPMPMLWQHQSSRPVGTVRFDKPTKAGIGFEAQLASPTESANLIASVTEAWESVKLGLVRAVSIGFRPLEYSFMDDGGVRFVESEVLELSLVTIPANADATIQSIKSFDAPVLAATGKEPKASDRPTPPAPGKKSNPVVKAKEATNVKKTIAEQIAGFEATRQAKAARMTEIMDAAAEKGETLDEAGQQEYDGLKDELKSIDGHLVRLNDMQSLNLAKAAPVAGDSVDEAAHARAGETSVTRVQVMQKTLPKGIGFTRFVLAQARAKGNVMQALEIAKANERWMAETPQVADLLKTAITSGSTSDPAWAGPLVNYQILASEFIEFLRPLTIIGRMTGLTPVPFKVKIPRQTGGATVGWVGEGAPKPLSSLAFDSVTLDFSKISGIVVLNDELVRLSTPSAELLVRNDLAKSIVQFMDSQFVDPSKGTGPGGSPASITNGVSAVTASGTTGAALRADMKTVISQFLTANMQANGVTVLMPQRTALGISLMTNTLGQREFPDLTLNGGSLLGLPVLTSENIPSTGGSPTDGDPIIIVSAPDILLADDGDITIDASREASLQMDSAPDSPATSSTTLVSLWQNGMMGIMATRWINWAKRRSTAVSYIQNARYFE